MRNGMVQVMSELKNNALNYVKKGFKVFPLKPNTKGEQVLESWKYESTTNLNQIDYWWNKNPNYNIGLVTGNGLLVIDIDVKNGKDGLQSIKKHGKGLPATAIIKTPSGGYHLYYHVNKTISNRVNLYDGIDIRGDGGYVLGIGSKTDKGIYMLYKDVPIANANEKVYEFIEQQNKKEKYVENSQQVTEGGRNDYLFRIGCYLQQKGLSNRTIQKSLEIENEEKCNPPLETKEVMQIIESVFRYHKGYIEIKNSKNYEGTYTVTELLESKDQEELDVVENMISIGLTLFGAPQKMGKTFFCLQLCDSVSNGKEFLGKKVQKGTALYLAFEDKKLNIRKRLQTMQIEKQNQFIIDILKPNVHYDVEERIKRELTIHSNLKIVVIDTFAKIRNSKDRDYESEYEEATFFHELAYKYHIAIILVTHVRKEIDINHPFDAIYGSRGLTAGSDSILVMFKKNHLSKNRQLAIQGKDIPDDEITLYMNDFQVLELGENEFDDDVDENLVKVINYIVKEKTFIGTHEELCSKLQLPILHRKLQSILSKNVDLLEKTYITYERLQRKKNARLIKLTYQEDDSL